MFWVLIKNDQNQTEGVKSVHVCNVVLSLLFFQIHATLCKSLRQRLRWKTWSLRWWHCSRSCSRPRASWTRRKAWRRTCRTGWIRRQRFQIEKCGTHEAPVTSLTCSPLAPLPSPPPLQMPGFGAGRHDCQGSAGGQTVGSVGERPAEAADRERSGPDPDQAEEGCRGRVRERGREAAVLSCTTVSGTSALSWAALFHYKSTLISLLTTVFSLHVNTKK